MQLGFGFFTYVARVAGGLAVVGLSDVARGPTSSPAIRTVFRRRVSVFRRCVVSSSPAQINIYDEFRTQEIAISYEVVFKNTISYDVVLAYR